MAAKKKTAVETEKKDIKVSLELKEMKIPIVGVTPLIMSKFDIKTIREIEESAPGKAKQGKKKVDSPEEQYESSIYYLSDGKTCGMPARNFKAAMVRAAQVIYNEQMIKTRTLFRVIADDPASDMIKITGDHRMRTDMVRVGGINKTSCPRYRAEFPEWSAVLTIQYVSGQISEEQIAAYVNAAGFACGVGEWRPEKSNGGSFGCFRIAN